MQKTRESIVQILKKRGQATVDELSRELGLTSVTVRHHIEILRQEGVVDSPEPLRRSGPGRPQHLYRLTGESSDLFPKKYDLLAKEVLREMVACLSPEDVERAIERIAQRIAENARVPEDAGFAGRLEATIEFLNELGFMAFTGDDEQGRLLLHVSNCPYENVSREYPEPCAIDHHLLGLLLGDGFSGVERVATDDGRCVYTFPSGMVDAAVAEDA